MFYSSEITSGNIALQLLFIIINYTIHKAIC